MLATAEEVRKLRSLSAKPRRGSGSTGGGSHLAEREREGPCGLVGGDVCISIGRKAIGALVRFNGGISWCNRH
jgi:hypothetical protein